MLDLNQLIGNSLSNWSKHSFFNLVWLWLGSVLCKIPHVFVCLAHYCIVVIIRNHMSAPRQSGINKTHSHPPPPPLFDPSHPHHFNSDSGTCSPLPLFIFHQPNAAIVMSPSCFYGDEVRSVAGESLASALRTCPSDFQAQSTLS